MINFEKLEIKFKEYDSLREQLIKKSRDVLKLSKQLIYSVHRDELGAAEELLNKIEEERKELDVIAVKQPKLVFEGSYKIAMQEYAEAILYYNFVKTGELVAIDNISHEHFILGLADVPGELVRKAVFLAGKGEVEQVGKIRDTVDMIYGKLLMFDFRENEIRRKVDAVKYDLRKLEDLVLDLKLKGR
jgi:translin